MHMKRARGGDGMCMHQMQTDDISSWNGGIYSPAQNASSRAERKMSGG